MIDLNYWNLAGHCRKMVRCSCGSFNQLHQNITGKVYSKTTGVPLKKTSKLIFLFKSDKFHTNKETSSHMHVAWREVGISLGYFP